MTGEAQCCAAGMSQGSQMHSPSAFLIRPQSRHCFPGMAPPVLPYFLPGSVQAPGVHDIARLHASGKTNTFLLYRYTKISQPRPLRFFIAVFYASFEMYVNAPLM